MAAKEMKRCTFTQVIGWRQMYLELSHGYIWGVVRKREESKVVYKFGG